MTELEPPKPSGTTPRPAKAAPWDSWPQVQAGLFTGAFAFHARMAVSHPALSPLFGRGGKPYFASSASDALAGLNPVGG